jgi:hypothetical protein
VKRWLSALLLCTACAHAPPPRALAVAEQAGQSPAALEARQLAPQAYLHAEQLQRNAQAAYRAGDIAGAQILSERSLAAYHRAVVLSRIVKAQQRRTEAEQQLGRASAQLSKLDRDQQQVAGEADRAELELKVARDAMARTPSGPASGEREQARRQAARSLATQAKLLCVAARLIDPKTESVSGILTELSALATKLDGSPAPIDEATALRAKCLARLTQARRPAAARAPVVGAADALLAELSRSGDLLPFRDDRGVIVTLRELFTPGHELTPDARRRLESLALVARAHPEFPLLLVVHSPVSKDAGLARGRAAADALKKAGAERVEIEMAGTDVPVLDPNRRGARGRNERLELVFVAPAW